METRDTILRLIEQTALTLRAFFHSLPSENPVTTQTLDFFSSKLKEQTDLDLVILLRQKTTVEIQDYLVLHPSFTAVNQEILADLLVEWASHLTKTHTELGTQYHHLALNLYRNINQVTQLYDWTRQEKIKRLKQIVS